MLTTFLKRYLQCWKPPEGGFNRTCEAGSFWVNVLASTLHVASNQCWDVVAVIRFNRSSLGPFLLSAAKRQAGPCLQDSRERFALEAEAESLRQSVEKMAMQVVVAAAFLLLRGGCACGSDLVMTMKSVDVLRFTSLTRLGPYLTLGCFSLSLLASTQTYSVDWEGTLCWNLLISVAEGSFKGNPVPRSWGSSLGLSHWIFCFLSFVSYLWWLSLSPCPLLFLSPRFWWVCPPLGSWCAFSSLHLSSMTAWSFALLPFVCLYVHCLLIVTCLLVFLLHMTIIFYVGTFCFLRWCNLRNEWTHEKFLP